MRQYSCKCGEFKFWGSGETPKPCMVCEKCGTTLLKQTDGSYVEAVPHVWTTEEVYRDGELKSAHTYCKRCHERKPEEKQ